MTAEVPPTSAPEVGVAIRDLVVRVHRGFSVRIPALDLPRGQLSALLGRSASGKSTLLRAIGRVERGYFARPSEVTGRILLPVLARPGEAPPELIGLPRRRAAALQGEGIGFVFQQEGLFPERDTLGNVRWALEARGLPDAAERASAALDAVKLDAGRAVATLSGGERKRLALARALALRPKLLLLDEPFTGLDPRALQDLHSVLEATRARGTTILMVTHQREDILRLADHLVFLEDGQVTRAGPRADLTEALRTFLDGVT